MLNKIATKLANRLLVKNVVKEDLLDIYIYGFELIISSLLSASIVLLLGALFGQFLNSFAFLITFSLLRSYTGGYHASKYWICTLITVTTFSIVLLLSKIFMASLILYLLLSIIGIALIIILAPVENHNKKLSEEQKRKFKTVSIVIFASLVSIGSALAFLKLEISNVIFFALIADIILLFIKNKDERRLKNENR